MVLTIIGDSSASAHCSDRLLVFRRTGIEANPHSRQKYGLAFRASSPPTAVRVDAVVYTAQGNRRGSGSPLPHPNRPESFGSTGDSIWTLDIVDPIAFTEIAPATVCCYPIRYRCGKTAPTRTYASGRDVLSVLGYETPADPYTARRRAGVADRISAGDFDFRLS